MVTMDDPQIPLPESIGRYEIKRLLGSGAMGWVYLAEDPRIKRKIAVKVVKMDALRSEADRHEYMQRFQREAEISGLLNHPGIVAIYDVGESPLGPFLAMEYVPGEPLDHIIKAGNSLSLKDKVKIAAGVAEALDHAHIAGIVHRDVKPGNVMITKEGRPKLMDFGIAKREDANLTQTGTFLGTPSYASPEQIREGTVDGRSDLFSFAVMVFEMLSGVSPFPGNSINTILYRIVNDPPIEVQPPVLGILPGAWQRVFFRALAKKPADRYATCTDFVKDLMNAATEIEKEDRRELLGIMHLSGDAPIPLLTSRAHDETVVEQQRAQQTERTSALMVAPRKNKGGLIAASILGLIVLGGVSGYLLKGGTRVLVKSEPSKATVFVNGNKMDGETPVNLPLKAGDKVRIEHKGFEAAVFDFVAGDKPQAILKAIEQELTLKSDPIGATVTLDENQLKDPTPVKVKWNQGVNHKLTITKGDKLRFSRDYLIGETPGDAPLILKSPDEAYTLDPTAPAVLKFSGGFSVHLRVDGEDKGELTASSKPVELKPGVHKLELSNAAVFYRDTRSVTVKPGQAVPLNVPGTAKITVSTHPGLGTVFIDGISTRVESDGSGSITVSRGPHVITVNGTKYPVNITGDQPVSFKI